MNKTDWLNKLDRQNAKNTRTYAEAHQDEIDSVKLKFLNEVKAGRYPRLMAGAFSPEAPNSDAYVEEIITPESGGHFYKLYGISYLYKGTFEDDLVHALQMPKAVISGILSRMIKLPAVALGWAFTYLFQRKKFLTFALELFKDIEWRVMRWYDIPENQYNDYAKELKRAVNLACDDSFWGQVIRKAANFIILILETDNAYRLRLQDALEAAYKISPAFTIFDVLKVLESREVMKRKHHSGIRHKWRFVGLALRFLLLTSPKLAKIIQRTLINIDIEKVKMDEADWYFACGFLSYNFRGAPESFRLVERRRLDALNGHYFFV